MTEQPKYTETDKAYRGLLAAIFGATSMEEGTYTRPKYEMTQEDFDDLMEIRAEMHKDCVDVCCVPNREEPAQVIDLFTRKIIS